MTKQSILILSLLLSQAFFCAYGFSITRWASSRLVETKNIRASLAKINPSSALQSTTTVSPSYTEVKTERKTRRNDRSQPVVLSSNIAYSSMTALQATINVILSILLDLPEAIYEVATLTLKTVLSVFPPWMRFFAQPFLILFCVPLFLVRSALIPVQSRNTVRRI
jgi:hypothetical protein